MNEEQKRELQKMIDASILRANKFQTRKVGDYPTDNNQLVNKRYVSSVFTSIQAGITISGNLNVTGSASIGGALRVVGNEVVGGNLTVQGGYLVDGNGTIEGSLTVTGPASVGGGFTASTLSINDVRVPLIYHGKVAGGGTANTPFPTGWSTSFIGTGLVRVIHNFGDTDYIATATADGINAASDDRNSTYFRVVTRDLAGTLTDDAFYFIVVR